MAYPQRLELRKIIQEITSTGFSMRMCEMNGYGSQLGFLCHFLSNDKQFKQNKICCCHFKMMDCTPMRLAQETCGHFVDSIQEVDMTSFYTVHVTS